MPTVQIDSDVYELLRREVDFRESESDVLRRLLSPLLMTKECSKCGKAVYVESTHHIGDQFVYRLKCGHLLKTPDHLANPANGDSLSAVETNGMGSSALIGLVSDPAFRYRNTTERYLAILELAYREKKDRFAEILKVSGRRRKYFAASHEEIERSGTSTHPRSIPGCNKKYWAMTNSDTAQKREILSKALQVLEYAGAEIEAACRAIGDSGN